MSTENFLRISHPFLSGELDCFCTWDTLHFTIRNDSFEQVCAVRVCVCVCVCVCLRVCQGSQAPVTSTFGFDRVPLAESSERKVASLTNSFGFGVSFDVYCFGMFQHVSAIGADFPFQLREIVGSEQNAMLSHSAS